MPSLIGLYFSISWALVLGNHDFWNFIEDDIQGYCPHGWTENIHIVSACFMHISHKKDFFDALKYCKKARHDSYDFDENQQFNQDISNLLTVGKLHYFLENALDEFGSNYIWLNAFKVNDLWYESHKVRHDQIPRPSFWGSAQKLLDVQNVLPITEYDFEKLNKHLANQSASFSMGENGDGLIYDPEENLIKIKKLWKKYDFVCTHMKEERKGPSCEGSIVECNDRGQCINGHCYCLPGYGGDHCYLNVPEALSAENPGGDGEGNCKNNDDFCLPGLECDKDRCPISKGYAESTDCCMGSCDETKHTCLVKATPGTDGQGICTFDKGCETGLRCGVNNCDPSLGFPPNSDCCTSIPCDAENGHGKCCTPRFPCGEGEGDCDKDTHCREGLICGDKNCPEGFPTGFDCCEDPTKSLL